MRRVHDKESETVHICLNLHGRALTAADDLVNKLRVFTSYAELVRAAITQYHHTFLEREARLLGDTVANDAS